MTLSLLVAALISTTPPEQPSVEARESHSKIESLRKQGAIFGRIRPQTKTSANRITAVYLGRQWKGEDKLLQAIPQYSVMLVSLNRCPKVSDTTLQALRGLEVKYVKLHKVRITDEGLDHLATMTGVKTITLKEIAVTDEGIAALSKIKTLNRLNLWATKISDEGVAKLRSALPNCVIHANRW